ncbi:MAG: GEVED domain-containing protein [Bacteroidota bacterium]
MKRKLILLVALFVSSIINAQSLSQSQDISNRIESGLPNDLPNIFSGVKICLDPGHGGHNDGNDRYIYWLDKYIDADDYGIAYWESNGNFYTALYMREVLQELGALVKLTREMNDNDIMYGVYGNGGAIGTSDPTLSNREAISNSFGAKYFQSIHTNAAGSVPGAATPDEIDYVRTFIPNSNSSTQTAVATKMANYHKEMNHTHDTQAQVHSYSVTDDVNAYAVLSEGGFHTHAAEGRRLRSTLYLQANAMAWIKAFVAQEGKENLITWGEIGGVAYSGTPSEFNEGDPTTGRGLEWGLGVNSVKVTLDKGTANEKSVVVDQDELDCNYNEGEYVSGGNHITKEGGYNGYYYFNFVSPGEHTLTFEKAGSATKVQTVTVTRGQHLRNDVLINVIGEQASAPTLTLVKANSADGVTLNWVPTYTGADLIGYRVYYATDDTQTIWKLAADENTIGADSNSATISKSAFIDKSSLTPKNYKIAAVTSVTVDGNSTTIVGKESKILSKYNGAANFDVLIVEGFTRRSSYTGTGNFINKYIYAIAGAESVNIASTYNTEIQNGNVNLSDFDAVVWVLGDESSGESTLAWDERNKVDDYLMAGGNLFISGSNIAWDLVSNGDSADKAFYADYLKAAMTGDGTASTIANGEGLLAGVNIAINSAYTANDADEITPLNGSSLVMKYGNGAGAGIYFKGIFPSGTQEGSVMYLSFGLEAAATEDMTKVLDKYLSTLNISINQQAPIANNDSIEVTINETTIIDVLANDTDANNDIDASTLTIVTQASNGTASVENGKINYTPNTGYEGNDSFEYTISDSQSNVSQAAAVSITVVNQECVLTATSNADYFVRYIQVINLNGDEVLLNISNDDGGYADYSTITADVVQGEEYRLLARGKYGIDNTVNPSYWKAWIDIDGNGEFNGINEEIVSKEGDAYTYFNFTIPSDLSPGSYKLRIATSSQTIDACGAITAGEIEDYTLNVSGPFTNLPPVAANDNAITAEDESIEIDVLANDTDDNNSIDVSTLNIESNPANGNVLIQDNKITYTPNANYFGTDTFTYSVKDVEGLKSANAQVSIEVQECDMSATSTANYFVRYVAINDINDTPIFENISYNDGGYSDNTNLEIRVNPDSEYRIILRGKYDIDNTLNPSYWKAWIDYNKDGDFDVSEEIVSKEGDAYLFNNFFIPANTESGSYKLRVATSSQPIATCGAISEGEIEDFTLVVESTDIPPAPLCTLTADNSDYEWISFVKIGNESHSSGNDGGYADYKNIEFNVVGGQTYDISLNPGYSGTSYNENWRIYIDLNKDGDMEDAGELVYDIPSITSGWVSDQMTIPNAANGVYYMRVAMNGNSSDYTINPCGSFEYGEVQDYTINISNNLSKKLDMAEINLIEVKAYPNPVTDVLNLELDNQATSVTVYSTTGGIIFQEENPGTELTIDTYSWNSGLYVIAVNKDGKTKTVKVIKN